MVLTQSRRKQGELNKYYSIILAGSKITYMMMMMMMMTVTEADPIFMAFS